MMKAILSYSHRDIERLQRLKAHSAILLQEGRVAYWHDRDIAAGSAFDRDILARLESCELFMALVSPDFLSSSYCYEREMKRAIARHRLGRLRIVPIILEPCDWLSSPLGKFKALPRDGKAISTWPNENEAWLDVVIELRRLLAAHASRGTPMRTGKR